MTKDSGTRLRGSRTCTSRTASFASAGLGFTAGTCARRDPQLAALSPTAERDMNVRRSIFVIGRCLVVNQHPHRWCPPDRRTVHRECSGRTPKVLRRRERWRRAVQRRGHSRACFRVIVGKQCQAKNCQTADGHQDGGDQRRDPPGHGQSHCDHVVTDRCREVSPNRPTRAFCTASQFQHSTQCTVLDDHGRGRQTGPAPPRIAIPTSAAANAAASFTPSPTMSTGPPSPAAWIAASFSSGSKPPRASSESTPTTSAVRRTADG